MILLQSMMDQMRNQLKFKNYLATWEVLVLKALEIPYLSNLNQILVDNSLDFLQQSTMVIFEYQIILKTSYYTLKVKIQL